MIEAAKRYAMRAHRSIGQIRKHGEPVPYWTHTQAVAERVERSGGTVPMIAAAHLHDVIEDVTPVNPEYNLTSILGIFGLEVSSMVVDLTDIFTKEAYPKANRVTRHLWENTRKLGLSDRSKLIKLADRWHNTTDLSDFRGGFRDKYIKETFAMLGHLSFEAHSPWFLAATTLRGDIIDNIS